LVCPGHIEDIAMPRTNLTSCLAAWVAQLQPSQLPAGTYATVRRGMVDCFGVLLAGRDEPVVGHAQALLTKRPQYRPGLSRMLADRGWASASQAVLLNATAAHALDYDDTGLDGHPSVVLGTVVSALAESLGRSIEHARCGYIAGFEVWAELSERDEPRHAKGWHPTAVFGCVAAAAATAWMLSLDAVRTGHAIGLAASMSAGLVGNFGSMAKPLQVGLAAQNGVLAGLWAKEGITASTDALEGPNGLLVALSPTGRPRLEGAPDVGLRWRIKDCGLNIKRYPICYALHRATDAALQLRDGLSGASVRSIVVRLGHQQAAMLRRDLPENALDAKFSAPFAIACALLRGHVNLADLTNDVVHHKAIRRLMDRVEVRTCHDADPEEPLFSPYDEVQVTLEDGQQICSRPVSRALGHASLPMDDDALHSKFLDCAQRTMPLQKAVAYWNELMNDDKNSFKT
jgi:2-methylcitrate dehydratase PrpD